jgi:hypothetical protein
MDVFVSVGTGLNPKHETFVAAVEARLRSEGLNPCTVGRNVFSTDPPLRTVTDLMDRCHGTVVIATERYFVPNGVERRGSERETPLKNVAFTTSWNQIEAAMGYARGHPLLVLVDSSLKADGLLEQGNEWFVQRLDTIPQALNSIQFNGVLADWRDRVQARATAAPEPGRTSESPADMSITALLGALRVEQLWKVGSALIAAVAAAFALGVEIARIKLGF